MTIEEEIVSIVESAEEPMTSNEIKLELQERAVRKAYGVVSFDVGMVRKALQKLVDEQKIECKPLETKINLFGKKE
jgi:repressor of nif and glnA expression